MKTKNQLKKMAAAAAFLMCLIMPGISKAQLANPYTVYNNSPCSVQVSYKIFDASCTFVCNGTLLIAAGASANITCHNAAPNSDDIYMVVDWIGNASCTATQNVLASPHSNCYPSNWLAVATTPCASCNTVNLGMGPDYAKIW